MQQTETVAVTQKHQIARKHVMDSVNGSLVSYGQGEDLEQPCRKGE